MENAKTQFMLRGFIQELGFRVFEFEAVAADRSRKRFTVKTDLALTRRYGIRLQELPLLCRAILEQRTEVDELQSFTYTEADMCQYKDGVTAREEAAKQRKPPRRPPAENLGAAWRAQAPR